MILLSKIGVLLASPAVRVKPFTADTASLSVLRSRLQQRRRRPPRRAAPSATDPPEGFEAQVDHYSKSSFLLPAALAPSVASLRQKEQQNIMLHQESSLWR